ncbi:hypothetical protein EEZ25_27170 [Micromonospora aurantiaca]|nr:hypothetical protein EEZ25_27170 [Micromonospora aurantiaca]
MAGCVVVEGLMEPRRGFGILGGETNDGGAQRLRHLMQKVVDRRQLPGDAHQCVLGAEHLVVLHQEMPLFAQQVDGLVPTA